MVAQITVKKNRPMGDFLFQRKVRRIEFIFIFDFDTISIKQKMEKSSELFVNFCQFCVEISV